MQDLYPLCGEEVSLFKTSISFIDHLQEFLSAILSNCTLVVPPIIELKKNIISIIHFLQVHLSAMVYSYCITVLHALSLSQTKLIICGQL